jgi:hypothetical protein
MEHVSRATVQAPSLRKSGERGAAHRRGPRDASSSERRVILASVGVAARRERMAGQVVQLARELDWRQLSSSLRRRRLLPLLGPRIVELAQGQAEERFVAEVQDALERGRRHGALLQLLAGRVKDALAEAGIHSSALKGPLLGEAIYGDPGRRPSADVDLLVAPDRLDAAVQIVRELGYGRPSDHVQASGLPTLHFALAHERGELPPIELHWRVHWYEHSFARERLLPAMLNPPEGWRPAPADELASLLLFYARDGFVDLRLAADLSAWWDTFGARLQPGSLDALVRAYPALARALRAASRAAERVVGIPANRIFEHLPRQRMRERLAVRLANPNPKSSDSVPQLNADMGLIDALLMPRGEAGAFVRRQLLPPREVLRTRAVQSDERRAVSQLGHCVRVLGRYGLTVGRLARTPERCP